MVIKSLKYPPDSVSLLKNKSRQFKIKVAEKLLIPARHGKKRCRLATMVSFYNGTALHDLIVTLHNRPKPHDISILHNFALLTESYP